MESGCPFRDERQGIKDGRWTSGAWAQTLSLWGRGLGRWTLLLTGSDPEALSRKSVPFISVFEIY